MDFFPFLHVVSVEGAVKAVEGDGEGIFLGKLRNSNVKQIPESMVDWLSRE